MALMRLASSTSLAGKMRVLMVVRFVSNLLFSSAKRAASTGSTLANSEGA